MLYSYSCQKQSRFAQRDRRIPNLEKGGFVLRLFKAVSGRARELLNCESPSLLFGSYLAAIWEAQVSLRPVNGKLVSGGVVKLASGAEEKETKVFQ